MVEVSKGVQLCGFRIKQWSDKSNIDTTFVLWYHCSELRRRGGYVTIRRRVEDEATNEAAHGTRSDPTAAL